MVGCKLLLVLFAAVVTALPVDDPVIRKLDPVRYQYVRDPHGIPHLVDLWIKVSDLKEAARYRPEIENEYHLFTRTNQNVSQPIVYLNTDTLTSSSFSAERPTKIIIHGWMNEASSDINTVLVPAFLSAEDCNVLVVDWSAGASNILYPVAVLNTVASGEQVAIFLNWLCEQTGASPSSFHIAGHSLGGQQAGVVGRNLASLPDYITAMDPALPGFLLNSDVLKSDDAVYTEAIHTNAGELGYLTPLAQVDFYPNGGIGMPGCNLILTCDHSRSYFYAAESMQSGGFTATKCDSYLTALLGSCDGEETLQMGGIKPKYGETGVYGLTTNSEPPFSMD